MPVSYQCLLIRELQFQLFKQEDFYILLNPYAVFLASNDTDKKVISIAYIPHASEILIHIKGGRQFLHFPMVEFYFLHERTPFLLILFGFKFPYSFVLAARYPFVFRIAFPRLALVELRDIFHHILIQLIKVDIRQYRTDDTSLGSTIVSMVKCPLFQISCFQELTNKTEETLVRDALRKNPYHNIMVDIVKESFDVALYEPSRTVKSFHD